MKIGFTADAYKKLSLPTVLRVYRFLKLDHIEATSAYLALNPQKQKIVGSRSMGLHLPNFGNKGYDFSSVSSKARSEKVIRNLHETLRVVDFQYALFHPPETDESDRDTDLLFELLRQIPVPLVVENLKSCSGQAFVSFVDTCRDKLGDRLAGICFDVPHALLAGEDWKDFYTSLADQVRVVHLSNCRLPEDNHYPFGMPGDLDLADVISFLKSRNFNGVLNFEIKPPSPRHINHMFHTLHTTRPLVLKGSDQA